MQDDYVFLKLRVFGTSNCDNCKMLQKSLAHYDLPFDFIDANDIKNERLCDFFSVDEMPVIQVLDSRNNAVIASHIGLIDPMKLFKKASLIFKQSNTKTFNLSKTKENRKGGCQSCGD